MLHHITYILAGVVIKNTMKWCKYSYRIAVMEAHIFSWWHMRLHLTGSCKDIISWTGRGRFGKKRPVQKACWIAQLLTCISGLVIISNRLHNSMSRFCWHTMITAIMPWLAVREAGISFHGSLGPGEINTWVHCQYYPHHPGGRAYA